MENRQRNITNYNPVPCQLIDEIEILATYNKEASIEIVDNSNPIILKGKIDTWFTKNSIEYLKFKGGVYLRLDSITKVNNQGITLFLKCT
jgi:transcriptional antiterminator Rof (Rho-off)